MKLTYYKHDMTVTMLLTASNPLSTTCTKHTGLAPKAAAALGNAAVTAAAAAAAGPVVPAAPAGAAGAAGNGYGVLVGKTRSELEPILVQRRQGLTLVHISAQCKLFSWHTLWGFSDKSGSG